MRLTAACPAAMRDDANDLAMVLAFGPPDALTYGDAQWEDADGNLYAAASFDALPAWVAAAQAPLARPAWDTDDDGYEVNMAGANRAQALLYVVPTDEEGAMVDPLANTTRLTVMPGEDGLAALAAMGLTLITQDFP
tara:strand:- start:2498 stop:2908 length:411 start_codon:yes stop_codon:yes gene_type:complete